jgi:hypothetical protein
VIDDAGGGALIDPLTAAAYSAPLQTRGRPWAPKTLDGRGPSRSGITPP